MIGEALPVEASARVNRLTKGDPSLAIKSASRGVSDVNVFRGYFRGALFSTINKGTGCRFGGRGSSLILQGCPIKIRALQSSAREYEPGHAVNNSQL